LSPPQISLEGEVVAGRETRVTCNASAWVPPLDPPDLLLTLRGGGLPPSSRRGPSVGLVFTAGPEQHGGEVTWDTLALGVTRLSPTPPCPPPAAPHHVQAWASRTLFTAGDNLTVTCHAEGNPPPRLRWELPANASLELGEGGTSVTILAAQREHGGTYRCLAENRFGTGAASVDVLFQGSSRSLLIPVVVTLVVVTLLALLAGSWWLHRASSWKAILH
ncbi:VGFR2 factor, partial [Arenaria interpres]|nr:VGFR2 factor [Arenaria interpres]